MDVFFYQTEVTHTRTQNQVVIGFSSSKGDVIVVTTNGDELIWMNETQNKEFRMKMDLTAEERGQTFFCVYLNTYLSIKSSV